MCRPFYICLIILASLISGACKKAGPDISSKPKSAASIHGSGEQTAASSIADTLKTQKLVNFDSITIGNAFDSYKYFTNKEWLDAPAQGGKLMVRFIGWLDPGKVGDEALKRGVTGKGIEVRFEITHDGSYSASTAFRLEAQSDGRVNAYEMDNLADVLTRIYANKKII